MWEVKTSGPRMGYYFMNFCGSPVHQISIYTVLALSYTAVILSSWTGRPTSSRSRASRARIPSRSDSIVRSC